GHCAFALLAAQASEILLVAHVGHRAFLVLAAGGERVAAAGDHVVGADRELAAPGRAPGQPQAQPLPHVAFARHVDHPADDVGAERAVAAADAEAAGVPLVGQLRHFGGRHQPRAGDGAADADEGLAADALLREQREVAGFDVARGAVRRQPGRQHAVAAADLDAELVAVAVQAEARAAVAAGVALA